MDCPGPSNLELIPSSINYPGLDLSYKCCKFYAISLIFCLFFLLLWCFILSFIFRCLLQIDSPDMLYPLRRCPIPFFQQKSTFTIETPYLLLHLFWFIVILIQPRFDSCIHRFILTNLNHFWNKFSSCCVTSSHAFF